MSVILINGYPVKPMSLFDIDNPPTPEEETQKSFPTAGAMDPDEEKDPLE